MKNKIANNSKIQGRQLEEHIDIDDLDEIDDNAEMVPPSKTQKISSSRGASSTTWNVMKGHMNLYFSQKSTQNGSLEKEEELRKQRKF